MVTNPPAYYMAGLITAVKKFYHKGPGHVLQNIFDLQSTKNVVSECVCFGQFIPKTLAYSVIHLFSVHYESEMFYSKGPQGMLHKFFTVV
jgi:hypothetical protein